MNKFSWVVLGIFLSGACFTLSYFHIANSDDRPGHCGGNCGTSPQVTQVEQAITSSLIYETSRLLLQQDAGLSIVAEADEANGCWHR